MSASIKSPDAGGSPVSGNPLAVVVHYNTTSLYRRRGFKGNPRGAVGTAWRITCTVTDTSDPGIYWTFEALVDPTGGAGTDYPLNCLDTDGSPIPDGEYSINAQLDQVFILGPISIPILSGGGDTHEPVSVAT